MIHLSELGTVHLYLVLRVQDKGLDLASILKVVKHQNALVGNTIINTGGVSYKLCHAQLTNKSLNQR